MQIPLCVVGPFLYSVIIHSRERVTLEYLGHGAIIKYVPVDPRHPSATWVRWMDWSRRHT